MNQKLPDLNLSDLTLWGWMLTLASAALVSVLILVSLLLAFSLLPAGQYPVLLLVLLSLPAMGVGILFFAIGAAALKAIGLRIVKQKPKP